MYSSPGSSSLCHTYVNTLHVMKRPDCLCFLCRDACETTQPVELLNPEMLTFGSDYVPGPRRLSNMTSPLHLRGRQTPTEQSEVDMEHSEIYDSGEVEGVSKMNRRFSFDSVADDRLERLSIAESEGRFLRIQ